LGFPHRNARGIRVPCGRATTGRTALIPTIRPNDLRNLLRYCCKRGAVLGGSRRTPTSPAGQCAPYVKGLPCRTNLRRTLARANSRTVRTNRPGAVASSHLLLVMDNSLALGSSPVTDSSLRPATDSSLVMASSRR